MGGARHNGVQCQNIGESLIQLHGVQSHASIYRGPVDRTFKFYWTPRTYSANMIEMTPL